MRPLPHDATGYAVEPDTRIVHTRYAAHAEGFPRTRLIDGVVTLLQGAPANPCETCYPAPEPEPVKPKTKGKRAKPERVPVAPVLTWANEEGPEIFVPEVGGRILLEPVAPEDVPTEGDVEA
jgi:hypothetical protein